MDKRNYLPNLDITQALLQTLNEIFQNTKKSTIIYLTNGSFLMGKM